MTPFRQLDRVIEVIVFAPLGAGLRAIDATPNLVDTFVARGRAEVEHRQEQLGRHVTTARSTGHVALAFGFPKVRNRASRLLRRTQPTPPARAPKQRPVTTVAASRDPQRASWVPVTNGTGPAPSADAPSSGELPIPGYDSLSASQVVERLTGLVGSELDAVRAYEASHRNRRTILGKIEQLASPGA
jgi:hypothetical protein